MGKTVKPKQWRNQTIVREGLRILHATDTSQNGNNMCQKDVGWMKSTMIVIGPLNKCLKKSANCKTATKRLEQTEPTIAREPCVFEQKLKFSRSPGHPAQMYLKGTFVQSTEFSSLVRQPSGFRP
jgi:hypothetical protein